MKGHPNITTGDELISELGLTKELKLVYYQETYDFMAQKQTNVNTPSQDALVKPKTDHVLEIVFQKQILPSQKVVFLIFIAIMMRQGTTASQKTFAMFCLRMNPKEERKIFTEQIFFCVMERKTFI